MVQIIGAKRLEALFHDAEGLDLTKNDLATMTSFLQEKLGDLLMVAQAAAQENDRDVIQPWDLPITKGLQETIQEFREFNERVDVEHILEEYADPPALKLAYSEEVEQMLPTIAGGLALSFAHTLKTIDPQLKNPQPEHWEQVRTIYNRLL